MLDYDVLNLKLNPRFKDGVNGRVCQWRLLEDLVSPTVGVEVRSLSGGSRSFDLIVDLAPFGFMVVIVKVFLLYFILSGCPRFQYDQNFQTNNYHILTIYTLNMPIDMLRYRHGMYSSKE